LSEKPYKEQVMQNLRLLQDDPDLSSPFFQFKKFAQQLQQFILDPNTPTPYTIGLHGEWGSGKTSLIYRVYKHVEDNLPNNWKVIWFVQIDSFPTIVNTEKGNRYLKLDPFHFCTKCI
jgi:predicted ATPase